MSTTASATRAAKRPAAKKAASRPRKAATSPVDADVLDVLGDEAPEGEAPLVVFDDEDFVEPEQVFVFELDGTRYYAPSRPAAGISLGYLRLMRGGREDVAYAWLIEKMLGPDVYELLESHPRMTETGLAKIIGACQQLMRVGAPKASPTSRRSSSSRQRG